MSGFSDAETPTNTTANDVAKAAEPKKEEKPSAEPKTTSGGLGSEPRPNRPGRAGW